MRGNESAELERTALRFDGVRNRRPIPGARWNSYRPDNFAIQALRLDQIGPELVEPGFDAAALALIAATEERWRLASLNPSEPLPCPVTLATTLSQVAECLRRPRDRHLAKLHANGLAYGYSRGQLEILDGHPAELAIVAGDIESWFGKAARRLPTVFAALRNHRLEQPIAAARSLEETMRDWLLALHVDLRLTKLPEFAPGNLAFLAGEGATHPKHIAYFLPSDLGVTRSAFRCSHYFSNVHMALIEAAALPLARAHLDLGEPWPERQRPELAALGVFAHEAGHCVVRGGTRLADLNAADRWVSVMMQEIAADVFGTLFLVDVIAPRLGYDRSAAIGYHLAECLRYVDRGLGCFADSDGMYLQLAYLADFGVLAPSIPGSPKLTVDVDGILAGLRSLARVLADTVLAGDVAATLALAKAYGPTSANPALGPFLAARSSELPVSLDYQQPALTCTEFPLLT